MDIKLENNKSINKIEFNTFNVINNDIYLSRTIGNRKKMEDNYYINNYKNIIIIAIADGHGGNCICTRIFDFIDSLAEIIFKFHIKKITKQNFLNKVEKWFINTDLYFINKIKSGEGCTFNICFITTEFIYNINLGDSKMIFISDYKIEYESIQHKPNNLNEYTRINKILPVINNRINNKLSISRTFGDYNYKYIDNKYNYKISPVICKPTINILNYNNNSYILLLTDGIADYINNKTIISVFKECQHPKFILNKMIKTAIKNGSNDNITLILIKL